MALHRPGIRDQHECHNHGVRSRDIPVLNTISIVPQFCPVDANKSLAKVMPGRRLAKKMNMEPAMTTWLNVVQSER